MVYDALLCDRRLYDYLLALDRDLAAQARRRGCPGCGGRLDSASYPRKPRGGPRDPEHQRRLSFCCDACRQRLTPPSVRFLARRVYFAAVVVLACTRALTPGRIVELTALLGVDRRTLRRWRRWWCEEFGQSAWWRVAKGRLSAPIEPADLPGGLLERFAGTPERRVAALLAFLAPLTVRSSGHPG